MISVVGLMIELIWFI